MIGNNPERNKAIRQLLRQGAKNERMVLWALSFSVIYALVSNLLTHCPPLPLSANILDIMASIDETIRNCCYGIIAGISFYLLNDFYKNAYKKVDIYNDMYPNLYNLWLKTYQLVLALNNHELDESQSNDELHTSIINHLCEQSEKEAKKANLSTTHEIFSGDIHLLFVMWHDIAQDKRKFLATYGHIIEREEYSKLNDKELDIMDERLKEYSPNDDQIREGKLILIRDYDIQRALYLILNFKTDMAKMVNKYSVFYYGDQRGVRKDAF